jgi:GAF domain-containing protein
VDLNDYESSKNDQNETEDNNMALERPSNGTAIAATIKASPGQSSVEALDWVVPIYDSETTEAQSMKQEIRRLQVLKSYEILESESEEAFERITSMASRIFHVPVALISLVDLGRQWFLSNRGFGDIMETPRRTGFCGHVVLAKEGIVLVPDATKDVRFKDIPIVAGEPYLRFYAGAPLIAPEGYKLGALCLVDFKPRSFTQDEEATLVDMAKMVVDALVSRKKEKQRESNPAQFIAYTGKSLLFLSECLT